MLSIRSTVLSLTGLALVYNGAYAAQNELVQVTGFGANPNNVGMWVYKPPVFSNPLPLIVAIHYCTGSAQAYFSQTQYANLADQYGFIVIYPDAPREGKCFDVASPETLTHNGGGDSQGIASMIKYAINIYRVSPQHVYVTGTSSGAMMTNVMAGSYPDLFQAASAYSGVPFACFAGPTAWNSDCSQGLITKTGEEWGDLVRTAYPGYTGGRPKIMLWHGTEDTALAYHNYYEAIKEWTNVLGVSETPTITSENDPEANYTKTSYDSVVVGYSAAGVGHTVPVHEAIDLDWFGIPIPGATVTSSAPASTATGTVPHFGQCGGIGYTGSVICAAPYTCTRLNDFFFQCL